MSAIKRKNLQETLSIPRGLSEAFKEELGRRIIEEIQERTERGIDKNGKSMGNYAKGSEKKGRVNLHSTGDTLIDLDVLDITGSSIIIGYELDHPDAGQINGIVTGEYGQDKPVTQRRDFIGLPQKTVNLLVEEIRNDPEFKSTREETDSAIFSILNRIGR